MTSMIETDQYREAERAEYGALLLDRTRPDWFENVAAGDLDMADGCGCIGGQLNGDYADFTNWLYDVLGEPEHFYDQCDAYGFLVGRSGDGYDSFEEYNRLTYWWRLEIGKRGGN